ncbi:NIPA-like protein 2 isoform X2 [Podarcis raffonei]|uniref:NIPA-like protein 2 isoform X2 n=1 Tax=Podarcis raffonei TaxID=65483 RepID=UPI0023295B18|nr:NIPA-like protein 2 isoform X2 [Podarcis raffonei]
MAKARLVQNATLARKESSSGFLSSGWYYSNQTLLLGVLLAIAGNILISISLNLQKYCHLRLMRQGSQKPFYRSKLWWFGIILMGAGEIGNFAAYGFASVMLVAPLGNVAVIGGTVTMAGTFLVVTFAPRVTQEVTARKIQNDLVNWQFLIYVLLAVIAFCILLYFHKRKKVNHIVILLTMVAVLASLNIVSVKAVATMITLSVRGNMQLTYPVFYIMLILMAVTCAFQVKFLNEAMKLYGAEEVIPMNYIFFSISAIVAGAIFYQEFRGTGLLSGFMFLFGCFLSFVGVFILTRKKGKECLRSFYIDYGQIPGKEMRSKIQPDSTSLSYGSLCNEGDSVKTQS